MIFFYILLSIIVLANLRYKSNNQDYISVHQTNAIKGIFIWLVFMGHILPYITSAMPFELFVDKAATGFVRVFKQLVVVPFLFYSGYGVMNSIKNKGSQYVNAIPRKRLLSTMANFAVAVAFFVILNLILRIPMDYKQVLLSLLSWESVGNSNWYIFTICFCYLSSYISYKLFKYSSRALISNISILLIYILVMSQLKGSWWYDTCLAYAAGSIYCYYKERIEQYFNRNYVLSLLGAGFLFIVSYMMTSMIPAVSSLCMNICSVFFSFLIVLITIRFQLKSRILEWSGKNLFPLYIYQRIPMILFTSICAGSLVAEWRYVYVVICAVFSVMLVKLYKHITIKL